MHVELCHVGDIISLLSPCPEKSMQNSYPKEHETSKFMFFDEKEKIPKEHITWFIDMLGIQAQ